MKIAGCFFCEPCYVMRETFRTGSRITHYASCGTWAGTESWRKAWNAGAAGY